MRKVTVSRSVGLSIGELSRLTDVNIETIRYYERVGIMPPPPRTEGGRRTYAEDHLKRLTFVRRSRELGFSLDEVRALLGLVGGHTLTCAEVRNMARGHGMENLTKTSSWPGPMATGRIRYACKAGTPPRIPIVTHEGAQPSKLDL